MKEQFRDASKIFLAKGGILRMCDALRAGVKNKTLYAMRDAGFLQQISRGTYRLASLPELSAPDITVVAARIPNGVICLISALDFHEITTQIPHAVDVAIVRGAEKPRVNYPPIHSYWFSGDAFSSGIETHTIDGKQARIYCAEKSIADAFKYRNKIGKDIALEALRMWCSQRSPNIQKIFHFAKICRVERIMRPYLEAIR